MESGEDHLTVDLHRSIFWGDGVNATGSFPTRINIRAVSGKAFNFGHFSRQQHCKQRRQTQQHLRETHNSISAVWLHRTFLHTKTHTHVCGVASEVQLRGLGGICTWNTVQTIKSPLLEREHIFSHFLKNKTYILLRSASFSKWPEIKLTVWVENLVNVQTRDVSLNISPIIRILLCIWHIYKKTLKLLPSNLYWTVMG